MSTIETRIYDGDRAREVLENEQFNLAFDAITSEVKEQWANSPARDQEGREKLWLMLKTADRFKRALQTTLETGTLARAELKHKQTLAERGKTWVSQTLRS